MAELSVDTSLYRTYSEARRQFLRTLGCDDSCRDPLSEFAERLVNQQLGGTLATSRVQKGYDLETPDGRRVQVKYLANPPGIWPTATLLTSPERRMITPWSSLKASTFERSSCSVANLLLWSGLP